MLVDPEPAVADAVTLSSSADTVVYLTAGRGGLYGTGHRASYVLPEPLALLRLPGRAPWPLPPAGQGLVIAGAGPGGGGRDRRARLGARAAAG
ncbi:MAG: hypothetical protein KatS3mg102_0151 [Planctomycetota bacterium]|nr:MAG: hypothetical protein KatS3mg102_0151 [Planctomycetota bacterium]